MTVTKYPRAARGLCLALLLLACGDDDDDAHARDAGGDRGHARSDLQNDAEVRDAADAMERLTAPPTPSDASHEQDEPDAFGACRVHVSVTTKSYGTGNNDDDDYAPNNVGAVWITTPAGVFVRTVAVWGPNYWQFAAAWVKQSHGSRVDIVTSATRKNHNQSIEADWDCRDKNLQSVPAGPYLLNIEFAETEEQSQLLSGENALPFEIGAAAKDVMREPRGSFGSIALRAAP
jgi:hypothetical protein